ncbi:beta-barrel assembly-enhancing protease [Clostridium homopropionicum DSM 5847]|uniref:Beta-barrel assembly-enhancing protease n=2 Tax=Clostridium TaxID=1485 RepID=A0A0L6Z8U6_9CLOT|nr:CDC27 family protein [Clostridium homopropionicum]KOA19394.1 beta-barrel assembly-enhancing protease [Clostridium homopropionicum DSM 5847]SFG68434.1 Tetratricopeptide repeat-containing protein [Clostridium homopropionicum]
MNSDIFQKLIDKLYKFNTKRTVYFLITLLCALIIILVFWINNPNRINKYNSALKEKGDKFLFNGEYDKAIEEYLKIKISNSKDGSEESLKNIRIAQIYALKGDNDNYNKYINSVKNSNIKQEQVLSKLMLDSLFNGSISDSFKYGEEALKINPQNKEVIKSMIALYIANNKRDQAVKLIKNYPVDTKSPYDVAENARMLLIIGDINEGLNQLKKAYDMDKDEYKIYDVLAQESLYNKEKILKAISDLSIKNPNETAYKMWLAKIYSLNSTTNDKAEKLINELQNKDTGKIEIQLIKAAVLQNSNKVEESDKLIKQIITENKKDYRAFHSAGWLYLRNGDFDKAIDNCNKSIEQNKNYPDNYAFLMPEILKSIDKSQNAGTYYQTAIEKEPYNYNILINTANYYGNIANKISKAIDLYKLASLINPNEPEIKYNMALLYFNDGKDNEAVQALKDCIKLNRSSLKYHRTLGTIYLNMGKHQEGIKEIREAFKYDENDILTLNNAGCYYIIYTNDFNRGYYNLKKAVAGINKDTDEYTKRVINENYNNVKAIIEKIEKGKGNESIKIPDFRLLY